jgi:hypothetical protein
MWGAISWFFDNVESGIILEDDIRPTREFFTYCNVQLKEWHQDSRILSISSCTDVPVNRLSGTESIRFSRFPQVWGWATWRDRWADYSFEISDWRRQLSMRKQLSAFGFNLWAWIVWHRNLRRVSSGRQDTWDYQWVYLALRTERFTVVPRVSLSENVGWGDDATHTVEVPNRPLVTGPAPGSWSVAQPKFDSKADAWTLRHSYGASIKILARAFKTAPQFPTSRKAAINRWKTQNQPFKTITEITPDDSVVE